MRLLPYWYCVVKLMVLKSNPAKKEASHPFLGPIYLRASLGRHGILAGIGVEARGETHCQAPTPSN
jgi:hypothetical protein